MRDKELEKWMFAHFHGLLWGLLFGFIAGYEYFEHFIQPLTTP